MPPARGGGARRRRGPPRPGRRRRRRPRRQARPGGDTAPEGNRVLAVGADTRRATVEAELRGLADLDRVRFVTMDMTVHYRDAVRAVLPAAMIVVGRWHVQKLFVEAAQEARKRVLRSAPAVDRPRLKEQHTLVGRHRHALTDGERRGPGRPLAGATPLAGGGWDRPSIPARRCPGCRRAGRAGGGGGGARRHRAAPHPPGPPPVRGDAAAPPNDDRAARR
ncbi:hypothetical protein GAY28_37465 [Azospirillum brasilense]|nr:hypothetical protein [Azospirillum brasilense]